MIDRLTRRQFVGACGLGVAGLAARAPAAHERATLAAAITVKGWSAHGDQFVDELRLTVRNQRAAPIEPVVICWGQGRQTQIPWQILSPADPTIPGGGQRTLRVRARGPQERDSLRLVLDQPAVARVYHKGTEQRAATRFTPTRGGEDGD